MFCLIAMRLRNAFVFASYVVNTCVDFGGDGIDAPLGEGEAIQGLCFEGSFGEAGTDCRIAVPVGGESEELAKFGDITGSKGGIE